MATVSREFLLIRRAVLLGLAGACVFAGGALADPVSIRASQNDGYVRMVFTWPSAVPYVAEIDGRQLTVQFGRTIEADYAPLLSQLGPYIADARTSADGQTAILTLKGDYGLRDFDAGRSVTVDLLIPQAARQQATAEPSAQPPAPDPAPTVAVTAQPTTPVASVQSAPEAAPAIPPSSPPASPSAGALSGPEINVRVGRHPTYTRVVFDWASRVPYRVNRSGGLLDLTFDRSARPQLSALNNNPPRWVGGALAIPANNGVQVLISVPAGSEVKDFVAGSKVVLDIQQPTDGSAAVALSQLMTEPPVVVATSPAPAPEQVQNRVPEPARETQQQAAAPAPLSAPEPEPGTEAQREPEPESTRVEVDPTLKQILGDKSDSSAFSEALSKIEKAPDQTADAPAGVDAAQAAATPDARDGQAGLAAPPPGSPAAKLAEDLKALEGSGVKILSGEARSEFSGARLGAGGGEKVTALTQAGKLVLRFDWNEPIAAAAFKRAGWTWAVFDKAIEVNPSAILPVAGDTLRSLESFPSEEATIIRFQASAGINPQLRRNGLSWILEFDEAPFEAAAEIEVKPQPNSPVGARMFITVPEPGEAVPVFDPEVGDSLVVVPVIPLGHGMKQTYVYPQFNLLASAQGIVVQPWIDDLRIRPLRQGVELTAESTLRISEVSAQVAAALKVAPVKPLTRLFDLDRWRRGGVTQFLTQQRELLHGVAKASGAENIEKARMSLAQFYFANDFAAETLAVLNLIIETRPEALEEPEVRAMRGAANFLMDRYGEAAQDLLSPLLADNDEALFWRAALQAKTGDVLGAATELKRTGAIINPYPRALKIPLGLVIADAAVEIGDVRQANHFLEILTVEKPGTQQKPQIALVEGRLRELAGDFDGAIGKWEEVIQGPHRPSRAFAGVARTELLLKLGRMQAAEAARELEKLRFAWRGGEFEFQLLRRLGSLYLEDRNYREGLRTLRQAATHFRTHPEAPQVTEQMADAFADLYLQDEANALAPVTAIALYDEFKELTPAGAKGDEMIRKLADRLVKVDLLDRAAELLRAQIDFRLEQNERPRVGAQLALVHIIAKRPAKAVETLDTTDVPGQTPELRQQRLHLRARATADQERFQEALALLEEDESLDAERLRAEIHWETKNWKEAAKSLNSIAKLTEARRDADLTDAQARTILDLAIALTLSGNERSIDRLRRDYLQAMSGTPFANAFKLIANPPDPGLLDFREMEKVIAGATDFQSFMSAYKERLRNGALSAIN